MVRPGREEGQPIRFLPFFDLLGLAFEANQHERWRALRMDEVATSLRELFDQGLVGSDSALEFGGSALVDVEEQRKDADTLRQHADQFLKSARPQRRLDAAYDTAPTGERHPTYSPV